VFRTLVTEDGSLEALAGLLSDAVSSGHGQGLIVLGAIANPFDRERLDTQLRAQTARIAGGLFSALIFDGRVQEQGWIVYGFALPIDVTLVERLSGASAEPVPMSAATLADNSTRMILLDGHARRISTFLQALFASEGGTCRYIGGGAGGLDSDQHPCIISNHGVSRDSAVIIRLPAQAGIGVSHGWSAGSRTSRATAADGNTLLEIDFQPAFDVYRRLVQTLHGHRIDASNMMSSASMFPIGVRRLDGSVIVRDPIAVTPQGGLVCVGEFDKDCFVHLLTSDLATLLRSAEQANLQATADCPGHPGAKVIFNCVSRKLLLKDDFAAEIDLLTQGLWATSGALSLGEVASDSSGFLEFYNKTTAVAVFPGTD